MHKPCFDAWDAEQEALEHIYSMATLMPPQEDVFDTDEALPVAA
jgi:hypothetical protein